MTTAAEVLAALNALPPEEVAAFQAAVADDVPAALTPIRAQFFAAGKREVSSGALKEAKAEVQRLTAELEHARSTDTDVAKRDDAWKQRVAEKEAELAAARAEAEKIRTETREEKVENAMLAAGLRPKIARLLKREYVERLKPKDDGSYEPLDQGGIPVTVPKGKTPFQVIAEMARKEADPEDILSNAESGGGMTNGTGGTGGTVQTKTFAQLKAEKLQTEDFAL